MELGLLGQYLFCYIALTWTMFSFAFLSDPLADLFGLSRRFI